MGKMSKDRTEQDSARQDRRGQSRTKECMSGWDKPLEDSEAGTEQCKMAQHGTGQTTTRG